jgi:hypothetical protein
LGHGAVYSYYTVHTDTDRVSETARTKESIMSGYGIKVQTDTGHWLWLTETGTARAKTAKGVMKFESEAGADMYLGGLMLANPHATLVVKKF